MATTKVTITNNRSATTSVDLDLTVISPTGITTPTTPFTEWATDMTSKDSGVVLIPTFNRLQYIVIPTGNTASFEVEDYREALYYQDMKFDGVEITVEPVVVKETEDKSNG